MIDDGLELGDLSEYFADPVTTDPDREGDFIGQLIWGLRDLLIEENLDDCEAENV